MKLRYKILYIVLVVGMRGTLAGQPIDTIPTEIRYIPIVTPVDSSEELLHILNTVSNAVWSVDRIIKSTNYTRFVQFGRIVWLESEDKAQLTIWRISIRRIAPYGMSKVVSGIHAFVYRDAGMTQKDPAQSFQIDFYPETGMVRNFSWSDNHQVLFVRTNGIVDYARNLGGKIDLEMQWDNKGKLISSNVYNWATRGQPIGGIKPEILEAQVTLKPEALEVSPGILTAFVRFPDGYPVTNIVSATCDGARAERLMLNEDGTEMIIKFRRRDIEEALVKIGESIDTNFVVRGTWQDKAGYHRRFQGVDSITKIVGTGEKKK